MSNIKNVVLLMGGTSSEREVSLMSGKGVKEALQSKGINVEVFDPKQDPIEKLNAGFDAAFIALHGKLGEDGVIQGVLNYLGLPYTGPGVTTSAIAINKELTKAIWRDSGISVPAGVEVSGNVTDETLCEIIKTFGATGLVVKPARDGSSIGVTKIKAENLTLETLKKAVNEAHSKDTEILIEEYIQGREFTVAILDGKALPIIEIKAPEGSYDFENKYYTDDVKYDCPADLPKDSARVLAQECEKAFKVLGARGWSRIDVMQRADGTFALLEINTSPGMTPHSLVPMAARAVGIDYSELCLKVLSLARVD